MPHRTATQTTAQDTISAKPASSAEPWTADPASSTEPWSAAKPTGPTRRRIPARARAAAGVFVLLLVVLLAGCSGSGHKSSSGAAVRDGALANQAANASGNSAASGAGSSLPGAAKVPPTVGGSAAASPLQQRDQVRNATQDVTVGNVDNAAAAASSKVRSDGGRIDQDDRSGDGADRQANLVLRVPPAKLDALMDTVAGLGHENDRTDHGEDVTASHADVNARVVALNISVGRLQDYLKRSGSLSDLVTLESQLTQRQSELQSTVAQQQALADQIDLATLTVHLTSKRPPVVVRTSSGPTGFGTALVRALHGLVLVVRWLEAMLGYIAPFALALAVVLLPVGLWWRQRRNAGAVPSAEPAADSAG